MSSGQTSKPYKGMQPGREVQFTNEVYDQVTTRIGGVEHSSARFWIWSSLQVNCKNEYGSYTIRAVHPGHRILEKTKVVAGRFVNEVDIRDRRKSAVLGTLLAGVVGVSDIMLVAVRERTKEIGIRKALGATPVSIIGLILQESVLITATAGYVGLVPGVAVLEGLGAALRGADFFRNPQVDLGLAVRATVLLIAAGAVAGFFPARRAAAIRPIEALRDE